MDNSTPEAIRQQLFETVGANNRNQAIQPGGNNNKT
jgi:hypothetical protein